MRIEVDADILEDDLDRAFEEIEARLTAVARGYSVHLWTMVLDATPQFFGRMTASWTYSIGTPVFVDRSDMVEVEELPTTVKDQLGLDPDQPAYRLKQKGHHKAVNIAIEASIPAVSQFKLGDKVFMANGVNHGEGPYASGVEDGSIRLRNVNRPGRPVKTSVDKMRAEYGNKIEGLDAGVLANKGLAFKRGG